MHRFIHCSFLLLFLLASCHPSPYPADIEKVLALAGDNRQQLEWVLDHYSRNEGDSLKLRAAEFLIRNMPGKCTEAYEASWEEMAAALYRWDRVTDKGMYCLLVRVIVLLANIMRNRDILLRLHIFTV